MQLGAEPVMIKKISFIWHKGQKQDGPRLKEEKVPLTTLYNRGREILLPERMPFIQVRKLLTIRKPPNIKMFSILGLGSRSLNSLL